MIELDRAATKRAITKIVAQVNAAQEAMFAAQRSTISGAYSAVSGLDQLGAAHGIALQGGNGSAAGVLKQFAEQLNWAQEALAWTDSILTSRDLANSMGLLNNFYEAGREPLSPTQLPNEPAANYGALNPTHPVVAPTLSLDQLAGEFAATGTHLTIQATDSWNTMARALAAVADELNAVAADVTGANTGAVFDSAAGRITEMAARAGHFSANAMVMAQHTQALHAAHAAGNAEVQAARAAVTAMPPAERIAAEQAFLTTFVPRFQASLAPAIPAVHMLMDPATAQGGGQVSENPQYATTNARIDEAAGAWRGAGNHLVTQAATVLGGGAPQASHYAGPSGMAGPPALTTPASHPLGSPAAAAPTLGGANGPVPGIGGTTGASAAAPLSRSGALGGANGINGGLGAGGAGRTGSLGTASPVSGVASQSGMLAPGAFGAGNSGSARTDTPTSPRLGGSANMPRGIGGGLPGGAGSPALGAVRGGGAGSFGGSAGGSAGLAGAHSPGGRAGFGGVVPGAPGAGAPGVSGAGVPTAGAGTGGGQAGTGMRGGMPVAPMMGANGAGQSGGSSRSVKAVTTAVELDENRRKLLGEPTPTVPGVIGDWAREQRV
ncbi:hypothetical protein QP119_09525 [Corynebacterium frankenforstense]|uniref:hypothetical protein n=2 Tax=Corynebacterium frankenforstense TaxID=1230998 RepID=UPI002550C7FA|nr:hypothetical protein [Corynebacterium frankenforstense]MDK6260647.1 hypothetical protein [Corynebacterium frankenforstense]